MLGDVHAVIKCDVVDNLFGQVNLGYPDLKALHTVIDTSSNEVRIFKPSDLPGLSSNGLSGFSGLSSGLSSGSASGLSSGAASGPTPAICSMASSLRLPGQHHAYVDIKGPANSVAFVSTPSNVVCEKLLAVAAGIVESNNQRIAFVKLANLDKQTKIINKGQIVADFQYLSPSLEVYPLNTHECNI